MAQVMKDIVTWLKQWFYTESEVDTITGGLQTQINNKEYNKDIKYISCPYVIKQYTNSKILVMEYIDGIRIDNIEHLKEEGYDLSEIGIIECGKFNATENISPSLHVNSS